MRRAPTNLLFQRPTCHALTLCLCGRAAAPESIVLDLSQEYYASQGKAFASGTVPYFISSNAKVARAYARSIVAYDDLCSMRKLT